MERINISKEKNFIGSWNINDDNLCNNIIGFFENNKILQKKGATINGVDEKVKNSIDIGIDPSSLDKDGFQDLKMYFNHLYDCYQDYKKQWPFLNKTLSMVDIPRFNIQKYNIGGHFAELHTERENISTMHRVFAWMTYLNNVDDGGETYFEYFDLKVKPEIGKTLIWPAEWTHAHKGEILHSGVKYIITGWMHFPFNFNE